MDFSEALKLLKQGREITRKGWEDKILYKGEAPSENRIYFTSARGSEGVWIPACADILAEDWEEVQRKVPTFSDLNVVGL